MANAIAKSLRREEQRTKNRKAVPRPARLRQLRRSRHMRLAAALRGAN